MPAPVNRVAIQIARGSYANLAANIAAFEEGELVYAKDENTLYILEDGLLVPLAGSGNDYGARILAADAGNADTGIEGGLYVEDLDAGIAS